MNWDYSAYKTSWLNRLGRCKGIAQVVAIEREVNKVYSFEIRIVLTSRGLLKPNFT